MTDRIAVRPEDVLSNAENTASVGGVTVRKGTVAAFIANAKLLDDMPADDPRTDVIEAELRALAPAVRAVGLLDVFAPRSPRITDILAAGTLG